MSEQSVVVTYEQARLDFFRERKQECENKLHWWKHQKSYNRYDLATICEKCSSYGQMIAFYKDAIERFGGESVNR